MVLAPVDGSQENGGCSLLNIYGGPQASLKRVCVVGVGHIEAPSLGRTVARSAGYYCSEAWSLPESQAVWRLEPGGSTVGSPCQDAGTGPCTDFQYHQREPFPYLGYVCPFRPFALSVMVWPKLKRQTIPRTGFHAELEFSHRQVDGHSGEGQTTTLGNCSASPPKAEHVCTPGPSRSTPGYKLTEMRMCSPKDTS